MITAFCASGANNRPLSGRRSADLDAGGMNTPRTIGARNDSANLSVEAGQPH
jgi:hypothetical protein